MSYILDALKKSEQQGKPGSAEGVPVQTTVITQAKLPLPLIAVAVLLLIAVVGWSVYRLSGDDHALESVTPAEIAEPVAVVTDVIPESETHVVQPPVVATLNPAIVLRIDPAERPPIPPAAASVSSITPPPVPQSADLVESAPATPAAISVEQEPAMATARVEVRQLPPLSSLKKIPTLDVTGHIYGPDVSSRSVTLNGDSFHEGDMIRPGIYVDQITSDGLIIDVDGYPLTISRRRGWQAIE
ncbi:general secretion pathway protein GspB [Oceanobacter mangrovi]|uniref:general secretion pathway protein GspB n=1 Tax=Oceanobacter mangrovi TaxID=2862510 RepID=UPI001C8E6D84|nr:general secretion pathway protein GspB [Oceanobacter mangrovi]